MSDTAVNFKSEKLNAYVSNMIASAFWTDLKPTPYETGQFKLILEDCFNAAFDFGMDAYEQSISPEQQAKFDRDDRISQVRRTALELSKAPIFARPKGPNSTPKNISLIIAAAIDFEFSLQELIK